MNPMSAPTFAFRVWHQFTLEWRAQWLMVLLWLVALATGCWQVLQDDHADISMPEFLPGLLALMIVVRSVKADGPGNADVGAHARPLGRGAVWLAKVIFFKIALLLPWLVCAWPEDRGYGYGVVEWVADVAGRALPAVLWGAFAALMASWSGETRKNRMLGGGSAVVVALLLWKLYSMGRDDGERCVLAVAGCVLSVTLVLAWWQTTLTRRAWLTLAFGGLATVLVVSLGHWNWRAKPERRYAETKLVLHCGSKPEGAALELWPGMYVTGLPADHAVSVVAFAPVDEAWPPQTAFSDYTWMDDAPQGKVHHRRHWMTMAHTRVLVPHYSTGALWHGNEDAERVETLKKVVGKDVERPWRLRLAVQRMTRVMSMPLREAIRGEKRLVLDTGRRLDFEMSALNYDSEMHFWAKLRRRYPLLAPVSEQERMKVAGAFPEEDFLVLLHSPGIHEVRTACEGDYNYSFSDGILHRVHNRDVAFRFPNPRAQMDMAGLKLKEWVAGTTLDVWLPEERGVVDLEVSAEEMGRVMEAR